MRAASVDRTGPVSCVLGWALISVHRYESGASEGFWRAAAVHLARHQREIASAGADDDAIVRTLTRHRTELTQWASLARQHPQLRGQPLLGGLSLPHTVPDALVFDYAPSYGFNLDCFEFDPELAAVQRAAPFSPTLLGLASDARHAMFGDEPYLAVHLRRDGYEHYCAGSGLRMYGGIRFGVTVTEEMCYPSIATVVGALDLLLQRHGLRRVLLATNSVDAHELRALHADLPLKRWQPPAQLSSAHPEWVPTVELLLCAMAAAFVGTLPSTFTASIVVQRDALSQPRNSTSFFGTLDFFARAS